jgi:hypothetical protein
MLKHKVYHVTTYNVDDAGPQETVEDSSSSYGVNIKVSGDSYGSYSSSGSYTDAYSGSISGNYSTSELGTSDDPTSSTSPRPLYDDTGISTVRRPLNVTGGGGGSTSSQVEKKDWNAEFQLLMEQPDSETKFRNLSLLARDFVRAAQSYAIIIINELCLPHNEKTIKVFCVKENYK